MFHLFFCLLLFSLCAIKSSNENDSSTEQQVNSNGMEHLYRDMCVCVITRLKHRDRTHVVTRCFFFLSHSLPSFSFCLVGRERKSRLDPERTFLRFPQCPSVVRIVPIRRERSAITNEFTIFIFFLEKERNEKKRHVAVLGIFPLLACR